MRPKATLGAILLMAAVILLLGNFIGASASSLSDLLVRNYYSGMACNAEPLDNVPQLPKRIGDSHGSSRDSVLVCEDLTNNTCHFTSFGHSAEPPLGHTTKKCETPEPGTLLLLGLGLIGMASYRRFQTTRRRR